MKEALALDPLSFAINVDFGTTLMMVGRCDEAVEHARKTVPMRENAAGGAQILGEIFVGCGRYEEAIQTLEKAGELRRDPSLNNASFLGYAYARTGRIREAHRALEVLKQSLLNAVLLNIAEIHGALGEMDQAFHYLDQLYRSKDERILYLKTHRQLDPLRSDARFGSLLQRMNLPRN